jgi:hypothetical protein
MEGPLSIFNTDFKFNSRRKAMYDVTFHSVDPAVFARLKDAVLGLHGGSLVEDSSDVVECQGVSAKFQYSEQDKQLQLAILTTPELVSRGHVIGLVHDALVRSDAESL